MRLRNPIAEYRRSRLLQAISPQIAAVEAYLRERERRQAGGEARPVVFFNASTRLHTLSLNAAFSQLAAWGLRAGGQEVVHLVCHSAMAPCVLGTDRHAPEAAPPCGPCLDLSRTLFPAASVVPLTPEPLEAGALRLELAARPIEALAEWESDGLPLGQLVLPSLRWILRRHRLPETDPVRRLFAGYLASAAGMGAAFRRILSKRPPRALVVFNGIFYPEAVARRVAQEMGIPVVTHEVGLRPFSAFFSHREATFREVEVDENVRLTPKQEAELDDILARRFRGDFTMAGITFWPEMRGLPARLTAKRPAYRQMVTVFTNVVFDTSQVHANVLFEDMFDWLDRVGEVIRREPDTLFVIRAHPDELRKGKASLESVSAWMRASGLDRVDNAVFVGPEEPVNSYELIRSSKFVLVYNSSVGLEATILGTPALCAGRARFTQIEASFVPKKPEEYWKMLRQFLDAPAAVPEAQRRNARAFLHSEWFDASLDLGEFLRPDPGRPGMVRYAPFEPARLAEADVFRVLREGILEGRPFLTGDRTRPETGEPAVRSEGGFGDTRGSA